MTNQLFIQGATIYTESAVIDSGNLLMEHGKIVSISERFISIHDTTPIIDGEGLTVIPGFIDGHIHGAQGADTMDATYETMQTIARALPAEGTTSFVATTLTQSSQQIERALKNIATYQNECKEAELLGAHLEGPFIHPQKKGAQREEYIVPANINTFQRWQELAQGSIKTVTLAPECDDAGLIPFLREKNIVISAGHTIANYAQMKTAVEEGVRQVTHLANGMPSLHHREVGVLGATFLLEKITAEVIADGMHLVPEMLEIIYKQLGSERIILITDAIRATGLSDGIYELGGQEVYVKDGRATLSDGSLAGSIITMIEAVHMMLKIPHVTLADIVQMTAMNPAKQLNLFDDKGSIAVGKDADLVLLDADFNIKYTICRGEIAYQEGM